MRISLAGPIVRLDPVILIFDIAGSFIFDKTQYPDYTNYDAIAIGAGGGKGADLTGGGVKGYGGEGGGGGLHRRQGLLEILDDSIAIVVGAYGSPGSPGSNGSDGGQSNFGSIVRASGGKGGKKCASVATDFPEPASDGGNGGIGGHGGAGGGGLGAIAGGYDLDYINGHRQGTPGQTGNLFIGPVDMGGSVFTDDGIIGKGGGGGAGGLQGFPIATAGGKGSYSSDELLFSPGTPPEMYTPDTNSYLIIAGKAGGARITPLNGSRIRYGDSGKDGVVAIRLTAE